MTMKELYPHIILTLLFTCCYPYRVREILESTSKFKDSTTEDDVAYFCKFSYGLTVIHTRSIEAEYTELESEDIKEVFFEPTDQAPEMNPLLFYLGLR